MHHASLLEVLHAGSEFPPVDSPFWRSPALSHRAKSYPANFGNCVPMRIRMRSEVPSPHGLTGILLKGAIYFAHTSETGAVSGLADTGDLLPCASEDYEVCGWFDQREMLHALARHVGERLLAVARQFGEGIRAALSEAIGAALRPIPELGAKSAPHEACGLLVLTREGLINVPSRNLAPPNADGVQDEFAVDPATFAAADERGEIVAVWHTHPDGPAAPSEHDRQRSHDLQLPYLIFSLPGQMWHLHIPPPAGAPALALIGRSWAHRTIDCFTLVRDWYQAEGLAIPYFEREDDWWFKGENLYLANTTGQGFRRVGGVLPGCLLRGDLLLFSLKGSPVPQHAAIYEGRGVMIHHPPERPSRREPFAGPRGWWLDRLHSAWRHPHFEQPAQVAA